MNALDLHPWRVSSAEATAIQEWLRDRVRIRPIHLAHAAATAKRRRFETRPRGV